MTLLHSLGHLLTTFGRHGPALLVGALVYGYLSPTQAEYAHYVLPLAAFLLTLGSFLSAAFSCPEPETNLHFVALALVWVALGTPLLVAAVLLPFDISDQLRSGILLSTLAPPIGSAAAIAAMLGLRPRLALVASVGLTLIAPLTVPAMAVALGLGVVFDTSRVTLHLALIVAPAAATAFAALSLRKHTTAILPNVQAASGISVLGLILVGVAMADGVHAEQTAQFGGFAVLLLAAVTINLGLTLIGTALFAPIGIAYAATVGLIGGNRNVTLAWAAAGSSLPAGTQAYVAAAVIPILSLPLAIRAATALRGYWVRRAKEAVVLASRKRVQ